MKSVHPLDRFPLIRTRDPEELRHAFTQLHAKPDLHLESTRNVDAEINLYRMKDVGLSYARYGTGIDMAFPESDQFAQTFPIRGEGESAVNKDAIVLRRGRGVIVSPGATLNSRLNTGYEHLVLLINARALAGKLAALTGASVNGALTFQPAADCENPAANTLREHLSYLVRQVSEPAAPLPAAALQDFEQLLQVMFLMANRHNYSHLLERAMPHAAPREVRRAEEYIEANARRGVTVEELAEIAGVSALSLFRSFKKYRAYSPFAFLSRARSRHQPPRH